MARAVESSEDFERIVSLPVRHVTEETAARANAFMTPLLTTAKGKREGASLIGFQGTVLEELSDLSGGYSQMGVGEGKALAHGELVLTPRGYVPIEEIDEGQHVIASDGTPTRVRGVYPQGVRRTMRLTFSDGTTALCDRDHLWRFRLGRHWHTRTAGQWSQLTLTRKCGAHRASRIFAPMIAPVHMPIVCLPIDPYTLGALLGDGGLSQSTISFTSMDHEVVRRMRLPAGVVFRRTTHQNSGRATQYNLSKVGGRAGGPTPNPLAEALEKLGLRRVGSSTKFVPAIYQSSSVEQRLELLRGLFDTDGHHAGAACVEYCTMSLRLADAVTHIAQTLGGTAKCTRGKTGAYRLRVKLPRDLVPFSLARKRNPYVKRAAKAQRPPFRALVKIEPAGLAPCTCIAVAAPDSLFAMRGCLLTHNTLITYCAPYVVNAERAILIVPAKLRQKTWIEFQRYAQHYIGPAHPTRVMTYHDFYERDDVDLFATLKPDLVMLDEVQHARKQDGNFTKRLDRWVVQSNCKVWCGTGTGTRFSIKDHSHMLIWGLNDGAPVPLDYGELEQWSAALDEKRKWTDGVRPKRVAVGVLLDLDKGCRKPVDFQVTEQGAARVAYRNRLHATPGVIISLEDSCKQPLTIELVPAPEDAALNAHFKEFREHAAMPDGDVIPDPPVLYTKEKQLGAGFYMKWDPPPPNAWRNAKRECAKYAINRIQHTAHLGYVPRPRGHLPQCDCAACVKLRPLDTPGAVYAAYPNHPLVKAWLDIMPAYIESTKAEWVSSSVVHYAANWAKQTGGIVWTEFVELGEVIAKAARIPYYGEDGCSAAGVSIENDRGGHAIVASIAANSEGRNLQGGPMQANVNGWHDNLMIGVTQSAERLEQLLGRTHRRGQAHPVRARFLMTSGLSLESWLVANKEARFVQQTQGQAQKILRASVSIAPWPSGAERWLVKSIEKEKAAANKRVAVPSKMFGKGARG